MTKLTNSQGKRLYKKRKNIIKANEERQETLYCEGLLKYKMISLTPFIRESNKQLTY